VEEYAMRVTLSKSKNAEQVYITKAFRNEKGKSTSKIFTKLGTMAELLPQHDNDREKVIAWAKEQARILTEQEKNNTLKIPVQLSEGVQLKLGEQVSFNGGYLFLQKIFHELGMDKICSEIRSRHSFEYDLSDVLSGLLYSRILSPSSKLSSYEYLKGLIEAPTYDLHDVYRALDVLNSEADNIQASLYAANRSSHNTSVLYYDCTNFFFEIEEEDDFRKYGKSKEHRPNPIVQMGMFIDGDGIPLAFTVFPGNENEQPTLIPLEEKIIKDYELSKFIVCTDAGLASEVNRRFNDKADRSFIVRQSLKQIKKHLREWALDPQGWRLGSDGKLYDLSKIDEEQYMDCVFHKERWIKENGFEQRMIVSFSPKYKHYQRNIRQRQVERAAKIVQNGKKSKTRNPNSPTRFVDEIQTTMDGEVAEIINRSLNEKKIQEEEMYDGFTAVCTTLEDDIKDILKVNQRRWEIEESFRIMKSEFKARPVYLRKEGRIKAHFLTCFLSLLIYRTLEKKLGEKYTTEEIIRTLRSMDFYRIDETGYAPIYTRTEITDSLHEVMGFRTDSEIILDGTMKKIIRKTKR